MKVFWPPGTGNQGVSPGWQSQRPVYQGMCESSFREASAPGGQQRQHVRQVNACTLSSPERLARPPGVCHQKAASQAAAMIGSSEASFPAERSSWVCCLRLCPGGGGHVRALSLLDIVPLDPPEEAPQATRVRPRSVAGGSSKNRVAAVRQSFHSGDTGDVKQGRKSRLYKKMMAAREGARWRDSVKTAPASLHPREQAAGLHRVSSQTPPVRPTPGTRRRTSPTPSRGPLHPRSMRLVLAGSRVLKSLQPVAIAVGFQTYMFWGACLPGAGLKSWGYLMWGSYPELLKEQLWV